MSDLILAKVGRPFTLHALLVPTREIAHKTVLPQFTLPFSSSPDPTSRVSEV